jgi:hypothetical protein
MGIFGNLIWGRQEVVSWICCADWWRRRGFCYTFGDKHVVKEKDFLGHLNSSHCNITFSMELERDRQLPFLNILVNECLDSSFRYTMKRKTMHMDRYLQAASHHPPAHKRSVYTTLMDSEFCDKAVRASQLQHIRFIL